MTGNEIRKTVVVDAPPTVVFRALTDERELERWMPQKAKMDARLGGKLEFKYHWAERGVDRVVAGEILELIPDKKLSYSWRSPMADGRGGRDDSPSSSIVTWTLEKLPNGKTKVTLAHTGFTGSAQDAENGWTYYTGRLVQHCSANLAPGD
jgi:uncharacterized protein YndB with AHSA1/START domain